MSQTLEHAIGQYLSMGERNATPTLSEFVQRQYDSIVDFFVDSDPKAITLYRDVKSLVVTKFEEVMHREKKVCLGIQPLNDNKNCFTNKSLEFQFEQTRCQLERSGVKREPGNILRVLIGI